MARPVAAIYFVYNQPVMPGTSFYARTGKPAFDRTAVAIGLLILSPLLLCIALAVRIKLGSPVLFRQERPGINGEPFKMLKFRTMTDERDSAGRLLPNEQRHTTFGGFLRSTSLDELPELWNVLRGDMSLVGPRPLLPQYLRLYSERQKKRHEVRPGITGWAQVNGRNTISWKEKFELDVWYVENVSFLLDVKILWLTLTKVVRREGINADGTVTMEPFDGTN